MKVLRKMTVFIVAIALLFAVSCNSATDNGNSSTIKYDVRSDGGYEVVPGRDYKAETGVCYEAMEGIGGYAAKSDGVIEGEVDFVDYYGENDNIGYGRMTASAYDDNENYEEWQKLFVKGQTEEENGKFCSFIGEKSWGLNSTERICVTVKSDGSPVAGARVTYTGEGGIKFSCVTGADGKAYIFESPKKGGNITVKSGNYSSTVKAGGDVTVELDGKEEKEKTIKLMFVVDVTGSMGDELRYLAEELKDVINRVSELGDVKIDLALLFYRDLSDEEMFAYSDFLDVTDEQNLDLQQKILSNQRASGGGDYPEAVDEALEIAVNKNWAEDTSTKLIFHELDAPPYKGHEFAERYKKAILTAAEKGIRISPVLASGADTTCEYLVRQAAIYTSGTFVYVTDHSGIGNPHLDPEIPDVTVEKLNDLIVRLVKGYYTGTFDKPQAWQAPSDGQEQ